MHPSPENTLFHQHDLDWWDEEGPLKALHAITPLRVQWIRDMLCQQAGRSPTGPIPLHGLCLLDVGCGGGLTAEPLTRLGAHVLGIDASLSAIQSARYHATAMELSIPYIHSSLETLTQIPSDLRGRFPGSTPPFDALIALEIVEHVANLDTFLDSAQRWIAPGGLLILSSLNRTLRSYVEGIVLAEKVLKWIPHGTHSWNQFWKPSELVQRCQQRGFTSFQLKGLHFSILDQKWRLSDTIGTNYFVCATRGTTEGPVS